MKLKTIFILVVTIFILGSCKSKKTATQKTVTQKTTTQKIVEKEPEVEIVIPSTTDDYISLYKQIAMDEMRAHKIPASITLAQGILESSSGKSPLALRSNNHFGIKCHKQWTGKRTYHDDDKNNECFRVYNDPNDSYKDHSQFLMTRSWYDGLFELKEDDYVAWAKGLKAAGYATDKRYPAKLIDLIDKYGLYRYDVEVLGVPKKKRNKTKAVVEAKPKVEKTKVVKTEPKPEVKESSTGYVVKPKETLYGISKKFGITIEELKAANPTLADGVKIGMELDIPKQTKAEVQNTTNYVNHTVVKGDTLYSIARKYEVSVTNLKMLNNLDSNVISIGQILIINP